MALPTWEFLSKSQTDNEKVEEAILRLILEHNNDEEAHLSEGQSLQSHKASEIIDHLVESVVEDKIADGAISSRCITSDQIIGKDFRTSADVGASTDGVKFNSSGIEMWQNGSRNVLIPVSGNAEFNGDVLIKNISYTNFIFSTFFESITGWTDTSTGSDGIIQNKINNLNIQGDDTASKYTSIKMNFGMKALSWTNDEPTLETLCYLEYGEKEDCFLLMGSINFDNSFGYIGIKYRQSENDWYLVRHNGTSSAITKLNITNPTEIHKFKISLINSKLYYYVDDQYIGYVTSSVPSGAGNNTICIGNYSQLSADTEIFHVNYITASRKPMY